MLRPGNFNKAMACHDCGQVLVLPKMPDKTIARCFRCNAKLFCKNPDSIDKTLALAFTALILFFIANIYPFLAMRIQGFVQETNLITGIATLYNQGMPGVALVVLMTTLVIPLFQIAGLIYICLPMKLGYLPWKTAQVFRLICNMQPWGMIEIYMLGILISMVKLAKMATIIPGFASIAFMILICILAAIFSGLNPEDIWKRIPVKKDHDIINNRKDSIKETRDSIPIGCHSCSLLCRIPIQDGHYNCPRCQASLHIRKTNSIHRTWALLIAAGILYFPANIFPVTLTGALGHEQADTILSGVIYFLFSGSWHIALIIFFASIIVPVMKLIILAYLLISVQKKVTWKPEDRTRLYRITEAFGRWSMVDIYVVTILVSLVQLGPLANITAGPGAVYFAGVVVITMFAARSFDPRLIWDAMEESNE